MTAKFDLSVKNRLSANDGQICIINKIQQKQNRTNFENQTSIRGRNICKAPAYRIIPSNVAHSAYEKCQNARKSPD
jgi:hypothetical protein